MFMLGVGALSRARDGSGYLAILLLASLATTPAAAEVGFDTRGDVGLEYRFFPSDPLFAGQHGDDASLYAEPEFAWSWDQGDQRVILRPFLRWDQGDDERTHADLREGYWRRNFGPAELRVGLRKVFWGVTESSHLVDIINQTDLVEDLDGEAKLGQPMIDVSIFRDWGTVDLFLLPRFRERTLPGPEGRPRGSLSYAPDLVVYESPDEDGHLDWAVRWSHYIGDFDIGVAHFEGTARDPRFVLGQDLAGDDVLIPHYDLLSQTSLDLQATKGDFLWKLEAVSRHTSVDGTYMAVTGGFELTFYGVSQGGADLGLLMEYLWDDRGARAQTPFEDDLFIGSRLALNDVQSTELLAGFIIDMGSNARFITIEGSRRLGDSWRLSLEGRFFNGIGYTEPQLFGIQDDDYLQIGITRYW